MGIPEAACGLYPGPTRYPVIHTDSDITQGTDFLSVFRCARGCTSLESFHQHIAWFIPGTSASGMHFQAYLLEGLVRWNEDQVASDQSSPSSYSGLLKHAVRNLNTSVFQKDLVPEYKHPRKYTGELIGIEYLYSQTGETLQDFSLNPDIKEAELLDANDDEEIDGKTDEGFCEVEDDLTVPPVELDTTPVKSVTVPSVKPVSIPVKPVTVPPVEPVSTPVKPTIIAKTRPSQQPPPSADLSTLEQEPADETDESVESDNIEGYCRVECLASYLFSLRDQSLVLTNSQATRIIRLWQDLLPYDKSPATLSPRSKSTLTTGRYKARKGSASSTVPGVDSTKRCFLGSSSGPAQWPDSNRYMEAVLIKLCAAYPFPEKYREKTINVNPTERLRVLVACKHCRTGYSQAASSSASVCNAFQPQHTTSSHFYQQEGSGKLCPVRF